MSKRKNSSKLAKECLRTVGEILENLAAGGIKVGAIRIREEYGFEREYRITRIEPRINYGGSLPFIVTIYGVKRRVDGSFGTHQHYVENIYL